MITLKNQVVRDVTEVMAELLFRLEAGDTITRSDPVMKKLNKTLTSMNENLAEQGWKF